MKSLHPFSENRPPLSVQFLVYSIDILDEFRYSGFAMASESYKQALAQLLDAAERERVDLLEKRLKLHGELQETEEAISAIEETIQRIKGLESRAQPEKAQTTKHPLAREKSFTKAIEFVLRGASRGLSPMEIRDRLEQLGYDTTGYKTDVVSSVHTVLKRFLAANPAKVVESGEPRRKVYQWNWEAERAAS